MKQLLAAAFYLVAAPALASDDEIARIKAAVDGATTMDRLEDAVNSAGATVFARGDHAAGAASVEMSLTDEQLLIFGNPKLATPAMQDDPLAWLSMPLRVLVNTDGSGQVWLPYEEPAEILDDLSIPEDAEYVRMMAGALAKLTAAAEGG